MSGHDIIVIGASAGGVEALKYLVHDLPADIPAAILIVLHVPEHGKSMLPHILSRAGKLPAVHATHNQPIEHGHIYIAPPNHHMLLKDGVITLSHGARENGHRPAVDTLFRSAARYYGNRVIGVVLTGVLDDGTSGLIVIKARNGLSLVQDPKDALYEGMPQNAIDHDHVDYILPLAQIGAKLDELARTPPIAADIPVSETLAYDTEIAQADQEAIMDDGRPGKPAVFACPDCGGALWEIEEGNLIRFRCRVGHAYSAQTLLAEQTDALEDALWVALRALEESATLTRRLAERSRSRGNMRSSERYEEQTSDYDNRARIVRNALLNNLLPQSNDLKDQVDEQSH